MNISEVCMGVGTLVLAVSALGQVSYNKHKRSVYGLSYDTVLLTVVSQLCSVISTANYAYNSTIRAQYRQRFPVHSEPGISGVVLALESGLLVLLWCLLWQVTVSYTRTRSVEQGFSNYCLGLLALFGALVVYVGLQTGTSSSIVALDVVDGLWLAAKLGGAVRLLPQVSTNWMGISVVGLHPRWLAMEWVSWGCLFLGKWTLSSHYKWHQNPVNFVSWPWLGLWLVSISTITVQKKWLYRGSRGSLELYYKDEE